MKKAAQPGATDNPDDAQRIWEDYRVRTSPAGCLSFIVGQDMNGLCPELITGTMGELLVQARLLQHDVQAAPPLKDSGNDLIAIRGPVFRAIQVKATEGDVYAVPDERKQYHILAAVRLVGKGREVFFDQCEVFLIPKAELAGLPRRFGQIDRWRLTCALVDALFSR